MPVKTEMMNRRESLVLLTLSNCVLPRELTSSLSTKDLKLLAKAVNKVWFSGMERGFSAGYTEGYYDGKEDKTL